MRRREYEGCEERIEEMSKRDSKTIVTDTVLRTYSEHHVPKILWCSFIHIPSNLLKRLDFPTFGLPMKAMFVAFSFKTLVTLFMLLTVISSEKQRN